MKTDHSGCRVGVGSWGRFGWSEVVVAAITLLAAATVSWGQRPIATKLLPENTVAYVRVVDAQELFKQIVKTAFGRMLRDPEVEPIASDLYKSAIEAFKGIEDELGLSVSQLRSVPQGELCLALVAPEDGSPVLVALIGVEKETENARKVVEYLQAKMVGGGDVKSTETVGKTKLTVLRQSGESGRVTVFFERDETIGVTTDLDVAKQILSQWQGGESAATLADNQDFATVMDRCMASGDEQPQVTYFADPLGIARSFAAKNMALQMGLSMLVQKGLDGVHGFGGSLLLGGEQFESVHHIHFLIDSSREGVLDVLALRTGDVSPEVWVPSDVGTYWTLHWDIPKSYEAFVAAFNSIRGPEAWDKIVKRSFVGQLGMDLKRDVVDALEGRITRVTWIGNAMETRRAATMTGLKLKDAAAFRQTLESVVKKNPPSLFTKRHAEGVAYYQYHPRSRRRNAAASYLAILGDYLLLCDNEILLKRAIDTKRGSLATLGDELDFKLNASRIALLPGGDKPSMVSFTRPEVGLRATYALIASEETRRRVSEFAAKNQAIRAIDKALTDHPLPPFSVVAKYFAFSGRLVTRDATGIHSVGFTFRRD